MNEFTPISRSRLIELIDITEKVEDMKEAVARGSVYMRASTLRAVANGEIEEGDVLAAAQIAAIMAAKKTADIIPMCRHILIQGIDITYDFNMEESRIEITAGTKTFAKTGAEMEAMMAVTAAALTIYDMCRNYDTEMVISEIYLEKRVSNVPGKNKAGGRDSNRTNIEDNNLKMKPRDCD